MTPSRSELARLETGRLSGHCLGGSGRALDEVSELVPVGVDEDENGDRLELALIQIAFYEISLVALEDAEIPHRRLRGRA